MSAGFVIVALPLIVGAVGVVMCEWQGKRAYKRGHADGCAFTADSWRAQREALLAVLGIEVIDARFVNGKYEYVTVRREHVHLTPHRDGTITCRHAR